MTHHRQLKDALRQCLSVMARWNSATDEEKIRVQCMAAELVLRRETTLKRRSTVEDVRRLFERGQEIAKGGRE